MPTKLRVCEQQLIVVVPGVPGLVVRRSRHRPVIVLPLPVRLTLKLGTVARGTLLRLERLTPFKITIFKFVGSDGDGRQQN